MKVLLFSTVFPKGHFREREATAFESKVLGGEKIHTLRKNANGHYKDGEEVRFRVWRRGQGENDGFRHESGEALRARAFGEECNGLARCLGGAVSYPVRLDRANISAFTCMPCFLR